MSHGPATQGFLFRWSVGVLLGLIFMAAFKLAQGFGLAPTIALERRGADAAQQSYAASNPAPPAGPRVVLVRLDRAMVEAASGPAAIGRIAALLDQLRAAAPATVLVDIVLPEEMLAIPSLRAALAPRADRAPVILALPFDSAAAGSATPPQKWGVDGIAAAVPLLEADDDGVLRRFRPMLCVHEPGRGWVDAPHFAAAALPTAPAHGPAQGAHGTTPCQPAASVPLVFRVGTEALHSDSVRALTVIEPGELPSRLPALRGAIVLVGVADVVPSADDHATPLGLMPGSIVLANAVMTLQGHGGGHGSHAWAYVLKILGILLVAALFARYHDWAAIVPGTGALAVLWSTGCIAVILFAALVSVQMMNLVAAVHLLPQGVEVGSLLPVLAVAMEALVEWGHRIVAAIENGLERVTRGGRHAAMAGCLLLAGAAIACTADSPGWRLQTVQAGTMEVERDGVYRTLVAGSAVGPDEVLRLGEGVQGTLLPAGAASRSRTEVSGPGVVRMPRRGLEARVPASMRHVWVVKEAWVAAPALPAARFGGTQPGKPPPLAAREAASDPGAPKPGAH